MSMIGNKQVFVTASVQDGYFLLAQHNAADGSGVIWTNTINNDLHVTGGITAINNVVANAGHFTSYVQSDGTLIVAGSIATNGVVTPPAQAAFPGTAAGADATVLNAVVAILVSLGLCASS